jgi:glutamate racemase
MIQKNDHIGIFDSGVGGISVLAEMLRILPYEKFYYFADSGFAPYGEKSKEEILERCFFITDHFLIKGIKAVVVACNTATSSAINEMRDHYDFPVIGMEPALKPAVEARFPGNSFVPGTILVMGTPQTIREKKYRDLLSRFRESRNIISLPCPGLVELIEEGKLDSTEMMKRLNELFRNIYKKNVSSIVLGCTHFIFLKDKIRIIFGKKPKFFDGNSGTAKQLRNVLKSNKILSQMPLKKISQKFTIDTSGDHLQISSLCTALLKRISNG